MKLLIILPILQLYAQISIFKYIQEKYGQEVIKLARGTEKQRVKIAKVKCDIKVLLYYKKINLAEIFTSPKLAITVKNYLRNKISRQTLETGIQNQYVKKNKLTRQLKKNTNHFSNKIGFTCKVVLYSRIENTVPKEKCKWDKIHNKKLDKLHSGRRYISKTISLT